MSGLSQALNAVELLNTDYLDLYGDSLKGYVVMPANSTFDDIKAQVSTNTTIGYEHYLKIGDRFTIAIRKFTWQGNVAKTSYLHLYWVNNFEEKKVFSHWREQKNGTFKQA